MKINLNTIIGLKKEFDIDGFINSDFKSITLDDNVFNKYCTRTRFTIAHEIGHMTLHSDIFDKFKIKTITDYQDFQNSISQDAQKWLEIQANIFAGCLLVPAINLIKEFKEIMQRFQNNNMDLFMSYIPELSSKFLVSEGVIVRRIIKEKLVIYT